MPGLRRFVETAEELGFESVLAGDHIVLPTEGTNQYPYSADGSFSRPSDEPYLETMTLLGFLAACTSRIKLGSTVIILPYRNPVVQAKMFASLDVLTNGRPRAGSRPVSPGSATAPPSRVATRRTSVLMPIASTCGPGAKGCCRCATPAPTSAPWSR